jgi:ZIP family zinc transporter
MMALFGGASLAGLATIVGAAAVFAFKRIPPSVLPIVIAYSAGMMAMAALEMLSESHALVGHQLGLAGLVGGMVVLFVLEKSLPHLHLMLHGDEIPSAKRKAAFLAGTITLHNIPEGFAIAAAFADSSSLGWLVSISIALQDIPEGMIVSMPAACYGMEQKRSFLWGALSGVAEFVAAVAGFFFLSALSKTTPFALGFSSGAMLYVVLFELLPDVLRSEVPRKGALAFIVGVAVAYLLSAIIGR